MGLDKRFLQHPATRGNRCVRIVAPKCASESRQAPSYILRGYAECAPRGTRGYLPAAWQRRGSTRPAGRGQRPYEADGGEGGDAVQHPARWIRSRKQARG